MFVWLEYDASDAVDRLNLWRLFETGELRADNDSDGVLIVALLVCSRFFLFFCWSKFSTANSSEASILGAGDVS